MAMGSALEDSRQSKWSRLEHSALRGACSSGDEAKVPALFQVSFYARLTAPCARCQHLGHCNVCRHKESLPPLKGLKPMNVARFRPTRCRLTL